MITDMTNDSTVHTRVMREARDLVYNVINRSEPIVAAIHGPAVGAGPADVQEGLAARREKRVADFTRSGC